VPRRELTAFDGPHQVIRSSPLTLTGSVPEAVDKLISTRETLGISYAVVFDGAIDETTPVLPQSCGYVASVQ
jgi:hypothetical protein